MAIKKDTIIKRTFTGKTEIASDTFKLNVSSFKKDVFIGGVDRVQADVEHCHFYHTFDSDGKHMTKCNAVGGHSHIVKVNFDENGEMINAECMPELNHTHTLTYLKSDKVQIRTKNAEYAKIVAGFKNVSE